LPVVLYEYESWSLTFREEQGLKVFENRLLRGIFGLKREEIRGSQIRLHNKELGKLYSSPHIIGMIKLRTIRWAGNVACIGRRGIHKGF
jgi:hypothetical protein